MRVVVIMLAMRMIVVVVTLIARMMFIAMNFIALNFTLGMNMAFAAMLVMNTHSTHRKIHLPFIIALKPCR